jgi:stage II sporulation protein D
MRGALLAALVAVTAFPGAAAAGSVFLVQGGGWGHGVGMSQWGAEGYALHGWSYQRILAHYYPHTTLSAVPPRPVRVLLARKQDQVAVGSPAPFLVVDARGRKLHVPARTLRFGPRLRLGKVRLAQPVQVEPGAQPVTLGGVGYRGTLVLHVRGGKLEVVNVLPLDRYLRGVVPYEMPWHWSMQAYEAQAVVARSYALATMHPAQDYDLFSDDRSQVYGGIPAERPETNVAVGATAGRVLTYGGAVITAYYFASSGGRTEAVQDVWPKLGPAPYLVPVSDPYDGISPYHSWSALLRPAGLARRFDFPVADVRVERDAAGRAAEVLLLGGGRTRAIAGDAFRKKLGLRSTNFSVRVLSLDAPAARAVYGQPLRLGGFVRGLGGVVLQELTPAGSWRQVARVRTNGDGRFLATVRPTFSTSFRLAVDGAAGDEVAVQVARRIAVRTDGSVIAGNVLPAAPVRIERRVGGGWRPVARVPVGPSGYFRAELNRAGQYRVAAGGGGRYLAAASPPVRIGY